LTTAGKTGITAFPVRHSSSKGLPLSSRPHLLIVEDERSIREPLAAFLEKHGYRITQAPTAAAARETLKTNGIDLAILDIMMPGEDGLSLARSIRAEGSLPIIMLTAMAEDTDKIVGLEMGADDYLTKPFNPRELLARIRAILRRAEPPAAHLPEDAVSRFDDLAFVLDARALIGREGDPIDLTAGDYDLLRAFVERPGRVLTRDQLLDLVKGRDAHSFDRAIDNAVSRLRRKIERDPTRPLLIKTVHGAGYVFTVEPSLA
jgi:two-component system OmpR family response regulator